MCVTFKVPQTGSILQRYLVIASPQIILFDRNSGDVGLDDMINGLVMLDVATGFLDCEPSRVQDAEMTPANLRFFVGISAVKRLYTDDDGSFKAAAR